MTTTTTAGPLRVGVDIGGTFTDVVLMGPAGLRAWTKVSSTTEDYSVAASFEGVLALLSPMRTRQRAGRCNRRSCTRPRSPPTPSSKARAARAARCITTEGFKRRARDRAPADGSALYDVSHAASGRALVPRAAADARASTSASTCSVAGSIRVARSRPSVRRAIADRVIDSAVQNRWPLCLLQLVPRTAAHETRIVAELLR